MQTSKVTKCRQAARCARTGLTTDLDNFFYGFFDEHKRDEANGVVMCSTPEKILVPVEDWRYGKKMTGAQIMKLAEHFYRLGQASK